MDEDKELLRSYSYAPGYDNIISMTVYEEAETNTYFYIRNHNNSVVALIDEDGDIAENYTYTAYGEVTVFDAGGNKLDESALGNRYTFQGREIDWLTGLYNFRARWYDAETGRWLSKDPIGINGGLNQYVFCGNNTVMFGDPVGAGYDLIGIAPDGSAIYGPERDWGSNYFDPYWGWNSGGKGSGIGMPSPDRPSLWDKHQQWHHDMMMDYKQVCLAGGSIMGVHAVFELGAMLSGAGVMGVCELSAGGIIGGLIFIPVGVEIIWIGVDMARGHGKAMKVKRGCQCSE